MSWLRFFVLLAVFAAPLRAEAASKTLLTGTMNTSFLRLRSGEAVRVVEPSPSGSEVDVIGSNATVRFYFDPVTTAWPRSIERVIEESNGNRRGHFSHGRVDVGPHTAHFSGSGGAPIGRFDFVIH